NDGREGQQAGHRSEAARASRLPADQGAADLERSELRADLQGRTPRLSRARRHPDHAAVRGAHTGAGGIAVSVSRARAGAGYWKFLPFGRTLRVAFVNSSASLTKAGMGVGARRALPSKPGLSRVSPSCRIVAWPSTSAASSVRSTSHGVRSSMR